MPSPLPPCQSIRGFREYSGDPRIIHGWMPSFIPPLPPPTPDYPWRASLIPPLLPCQSIRGYSGDRGSFMDAQLHTPPLSEYPRNPWILWTSADHPWRASFHGGPASLSGPSSLEWRMGTVPIFADQTSEIVAHFCHYSHDEWSGER